MKTRIQENIDRGRTESTEEGVMRSNDYDGDTFKLFFFFFFFGFLFLHVSRFLGMKIVWTTYIKKDNIREPLLACDQQSSGVFKILWALAPDRLFI